MLASVANNLPYGPSRRVHGKHEFFAAVKLHAFCSTLFHFFNFHDHLYDFSECVAFLEQPATEMKKGVSLRIRSAQGRDWENEYSVSLTLQRGP